MFVLAVLPISALLFFVTAPMWSLSNAMLAAALQALTGVMFIECMLLNWSKVPFASAHTPSPDVLKSYWPVYICALHAFAFRLSDWQLVALSSSRALGWYVALMFAIIVTVRILRYRRMRAGALEFDVTASHAVERLNLSEALN